MGHSDHRAGMPLLRQLGTKPERGALHATSVEGGLTRRLPCDGAMAAATFAKAKLRPMCVGRDHRGLGLHPPAAVRATQSARRRPDVDLDSVTVGCVAVLAAFSFEVLDELFNRGGTGVRHHHDDGETDESQVDVQGELRLT